MRDVEEPCLSTFEDGDGVQHIVYGWMGLYRGPAVTHVGRVVVERSPSWQETVSPQYLRLVRRKP
jgi:hypothetical protein